MCVRLEIAGIEKLQKVISAMSWIRVEESFHLRIFEGRGERKFAYRFTQIACTG